MKKVLLTRFGGIGDVAPVAAVAEQLHKQGWTVDMALRCDGPMKQSSLFMNCEYVNKAMDYKQMGPWGDRNVKYKRGWKSIETIYKDYNEVIDFMNVVENNNTCKSIEMEEPTDRWKLSRNSNWCNWYDTHLAWANINPRSVPDEEKRPKFVLSKKEQSIIDGVRKRFDKIFCIHPAASAMARTWYQAQDLVNLLQKEHRDCLVILWNPNGNDWAFISTSPDGPVVVDVKDPIRRSVVMVGMSDVFVGADTGFTHVAEGLGIKHICIYSTVPWWTRAQYYKHQAHIDLGEQHPEYHTFCLLSGDPLNIKEGMEALTKREKKILEMHKNKLSAEDARKELNTDAHGLNMEFEALQRKIESFDRVQSKSLSGVTPDMVFNKIKELTNG